MEIGVNVTSLWTRQSVLGRLGSPVPIALLPGSDFDGSVGSGFASTPSDPLRTSVKPTLRMITPPHLTVTDQLVVGALAFANDGGTLIGGIDRVRFHFEGNSADVIEPSFQEFVRHDGSTYSLFGYWVALTKGTQLGVAELYAEAIPADASMQNRVIGPYTYVLRDDEFEYDITMDPSQPQVPGQNYHSLLTAWQFLRSVNAQTARVTGSGANVDVSGFVNYAHFEPVGRIVVEWTEPVTIGASVESVGEWLISIGKLHWRGTNITFDMRYIVNFGSRTGYSQPLFERVRFTNSAGFGDTTYAKGPTGIPFLFEDLGDQGVWLTECAFDFLLNPTEQQAELVRGCTFENIGNDLFSFAKAVVANVVTEYDSTPYREELDALTVLGPVGATLSISNGNDATTRTITAKISGSEIDTFLVGRAASYVGGDQFNIADVVDWINALNGWSAVLLDDTRRATSLGLSGTNGGAFADVDVSNGLTLVSQFDLHPDWYQGVISSSASLENIVVFGNETSQSLAQLIFLTNGTYRDFAIVNNAFHQKDDSGYLSQLDATFQNLLFVHNSFSGQRVLLRSEYSDDAHTLIASNVFDNSGIEPGASSNGVYKNNHYFSASNLIAGDSSATIGGNSSSLYLNAASGNFTPQGELIQNLKPPVFSYDLHGKKRGATAPAGALV